MKTKINAISHQVQELVAWIRGFEESGLISIDCISLNTRDRLRSEGLI